MTFQTPEEIRYRHEKTWQELACEHISRRALWDHEDWLKQQEMQEPQKMQETLDIICGISVLVGSGLVIGVIIGAWCF